MRRSWRALTVSAVAAALLVPANSASARGDGWQPYGYPAEIDAACGSTVVHVTFPDVKEFQRLLPQPDGTTIQQITGTDRTRFTTDAGASVTVNSSGPAENVLFPNGDMEVRSMGRYSNGLTPTQARQLGTPQIFVSSGLIDFIQHADGSMTPIIVPHHVTDICAALGAA